MFPNAHEICSPNKENWWEQLGAYSLTVGLQNSGIIQSGRDLRRSLIKPSAVLRPSCSVFLWNWDLSISGDCTISLADHLHEVEKTSQFNLVYSEHQFNELVPTASCCSTVECLASSSQYWRAPKSPQITFLENQCLAPSSLCRRKKCSSPQPPWWPLVELPWVWELSYIGVPKMDGLLRCIISNISLWNQLFLPQGNAVFSSSLLTTRAGLHSIEKSVPKMPLYLFVIKSIFYKSVCGKIHCVPQPLVNFSCIQTTIYDLKAFSTESFTTKLGIERNN